MKIILPNAKELNTHQDGQDFVPLSPMAEGVRSVLGEYSVSELARFYRIKEEKAQQEWERWQRIQQGQAKRYPAWQLYDGLMYRYMKRTGLSAEETGYLKRHAVIATSLYGLISVFEPIAPHRLDFQGQLSLEGQSLTHYWRGQYDQMVEEDSLLINLVSSEFEAVFSPAIRKRMVKVVFMENCGGHLKVHSTISKKGRGRLLSAMAANQVGTLGQLKSLAVDDFSYEVSLSEEKKLVFVR